MNPGNTKVEHQPLLSPSAVAVLQMLVAYSKLKQNINPLQQTEFLKHASLPNSDFLLTRYVFVNWIIFFKNYLPERNPKTFMNRSRSYDVQIKKGMLNAILCDIPTCQMS